MRNMAYILLPFLFIFLPSQYAHSQFLQFNLQVEPEIRAYVAQPLDFGTVLSNSGRISIEPGSPRMGIFEITAMNNQFVEVTIDYPEQLETSNNPGNENVIPLQLHARYTPSDNVGFGSAINFNGNTANFEIGSNVSSTHNWEVARVYVYGSAEVGNVASGVYTGAILLQVVIN